MNRDETLLCKQANQIDLVDYLNSLGHRPQKSRGNDYWFLSPLRKESTASFKVNRKLNLWYDHGNGTGGTLVDFGILYFKCSVKDLLKRLRDEKELVFSFRPQAFLPAVESKEAAETTSRIKITSAQEIRNAGLVNYLRNRKIPLAIANEFCQEVAFELYDKKQLALGFKNNSGGYELRNENFKGSSSPKEPKIIRREGAKSLAVFEGFFDFLSFQTLLKSTKANKLELPIIQSDFLVLNSISFFEKQRAVMEQYPSIHLFLDHDNIGMACTKKALKWSGKYKDESHFYRQFKDLNEFLVKFAGQQTKQRHTRRLGL